MSKNTFYVTTPIYYATAKPHLGSLYSTLLADVVARWQKLQGKDVFFVTGTDEHGQKIAQAAEKAGMQPKEFIDQFVPAYYETWNLYDIEFDRFIRTTDPYHIRGAQKLVQTLLDSGDIYKSTYEGWYCTPCETFVIEKSLHRGDEVPLCPSCHRETHLVSEETYFFKLSKYQNKLLDFYKKHPDFIVPRERTNEVISFVESGLKDLSISRTTVKWGVPFPQDPKHSIYVWVEALCNYITVIGYGDTHREDEFKKWWPANLHIVGKDIIRFHAVYWPAFLMAAKLSLPKQLLVHGWIKVDKQKMSKSLQNVVDPVVLQKNYGVEPVRYYLLRQIPVNQDGDFSIADLEQRIESELANDLGNLLNRMVTLALKNNLKTVNAPKTWAERALNLRDECWNMIEDYESYMSDYMFHLALARLWKYINKVNAYFHEQEPWKQAINNPELFIETISATAHSLRLIAYLLWPIMPNKMTALLGSLGETFELENNTLENLELGIWKSTFNLQKIPTLFEKPITEEKKEMKEQAQEVKKVQDQDKQKYLSIDDFVKVELVVGTITSCKEMENSDKLLQMQVDFGPKGTRQILSGIKKWYSPDDVIGKQAIFVFNLKPRKMLGAESQGMMLMADDGRPYLTTLEKQIPNGARLK